MEGQIGECFAIDTFMHVLKFYFYLVPQCSVVIPILVTLIIMISHHSCLKDVTSQSYPISGCTRVNHARYSSVQVTFCSRSNT